MAAAFPHFTPEGVIPAVLLPFLDDFSIDEASFRQHLRDVAAVRGLAALTVNAHSTEVATCSFDEQTRVLATTMDEVGDVLPVVAGVASESTLQAKKIAKMSADAGASALLVFPPRVFFEGAMHRPAMILDYYRNIAEVTDLPLILFQFPAGKGGATPLTTLAQLAEEMPSLQAIKDYANDPVTVERNYRFLHALPRPIKVLSTHTAWLMGSLVLGCDGLLSGSGSTIAALQVELFEAIKRGDLFAAQAVNDRMYHVTRLFYADPFCDMHNRMKHAQVLLGRLPSALPRQPLLPLEQSEIDRIAEGLTAAGLMPTTASPSDQGVAAARQTVAA
ncbi:4-hydroxy-tetrahydrodipicolinate synthase [Sphingomonas vulcanisoli]|uniref:4-hydroxy-tetrahydrodipicolinate synthase n=1 Tax=Sphingomonas vulcanisoli TaxID=1658060 RepID=A0ABX0TSI3_9SPHN|nr:dihydrodipicolinate synthase family protein [Sphingomonas vulcanisoli]NIJ08483.1 4-hydroxy-tetrahydrodipicolinate synthase [Sphingomonas vulcanisoli]